MEQKYGSLTADQLFYALENSTIVKQMIRHMAPLEQYNDTPAIQALGIYRPEVKTVKIT